MVKLSLSKFLDLLNRHKYTLHGVYSEGNKIRFLECRTPKQQKTFIIYLPDKYKMKLGSSTSLKRFNIIPSDDLPSSRQIKYMSDIKGPLIECDLLSVSSSLLCMYKNSGETICYLIGDEKESKDESVEEEEIDQITVIEQKAIKTLKKIEPDIELPIIEKRNEEENEEENEEQEEENEEEQDGQEEENEDELVFEDADGKPFDEVKHILSQDKTIEQDLENLKKKVSSEETEEDGEDELHIIQDNSLPPQLEDSDVSLGIIYIAINAGSFFKKIKTYEKELIGFYEQLDDNELDTRKEKLKTLSENTADFLAKAKERIDNIQNEEKELKFQLVRLTIVLTQIDAVKLKVVSNEKKYGIELTQELEKIHRKTRSTIHELNINLLKLRDSADELLSNYLSSIKELKEL